MSEDIFVSLEEEQAIMAGVNNLLEVEPSSSSSSSGWVEVVEPTGIPALREELAVLVSTGNPKRQSG